MRKALYSLLIACIFTVYGNSTSELKEKIAKLQGISNIEQLELTPYKEKYVLRITQPLDHRNPDAGSFTQRVIIGHTGFDRPTILVTEGYGGDYALRQNYREELSELLDANIVFVEHRYFQESKPEPCDWNYLTAENSAYDLHTIRTILRDIYPNKWISTGISKGGQTTIIYRTYFPDDVAFSVPYVAPVCRAMEDGRHEPFLRKVGTGKQRKKIKAFQLEVLKRKPAMIEKMKDFCDNNRLTHKMSMAELLDYCVLEYSFSIWQWGTSTETIPDPASDNNTLFDHLITISSPSYFSEGQPTSSFFVQAAKELGYYGYDTEPFKDYLSIKTTKGYLPRYMLPDDIYQIDFNPALYHKITRFLKENDPKMIFIYGSADPWTAARVPHFKGKKNEHIFIQPSGSHLSRINNMPGKIRKSILKLINAWLAE